MMYILLASGGYGAHILTTFMNRKQNGISTDRQSGLVPDTNGIFLITSGNDGRA
jgi:hypothetical protein